MTDAKPRTQHKEAVRILTKIKQVVGKTIDRGWQQHGSLPIGIEKVEDGILIRYKQKVTTTKPTGLAQSKEE